MALSKKRRPRPDRKTAIRRRRLQELREEADRPVNVNPRRETPWAY